MKLFLNIYEYFYALLFNQNIDAEVIKRCETEGLNASVSGLNHLSNPYKVGTPEYKAWNRGFWVW